MHSSTTTSSSSNNNHHKKKSNEYGNPPRGSLTEKRGRVAHETIGHEVLELCRVLSNFPEGTATFQQLFQIYETKNNKVVGLLLRAKRHGLLTFDKKNKEMLFQGQDDNVLICLTSTHVSEDEEHIPRDKKSSKRSFNHPNDDQPSEDSFQWGNSLSC